MITLVKTTKMKSLLFAALIFASLNASAQIAKSKLLVFATAMPEKTILDKEELARFTKYWYRLTEKFEELKIEKLQDKYFLLARTETKVYAYRLLKIDAEYYLSNTMQVSSCECDCMDIKEFIVQKNVVIGCRTGTHTAASAF